MASFVLEIAGSLLIAVLGFLALIKIFRSAKARKQVWDAFKDVEENSELERREGLSTSYGMPDLVGEIEGRKVYIHPVRSRRGKGARPSKTIYAVESGIDLDENIIISSPETTEQDENLASLDVPKLERYGLKVDTERHDNQEVVDNLITKDVANKINRIVVKNGDDFRALILEPGIVMFSTFNIEIDREKMKENLEDTVKLVESMEKDYPDLEEDLKNERIIELKNVSRTVYLDMAIMLGVVGASSYVLYTSLIDFSFLFMNFGIMLFLLGTSRLGSIVYTRGWLKG